MRSKLDRESPEDRMRDAATRTATRIWNDVDATVPEPERRPYTFLLLVRGFGREETLLSAGDAVQRLMRGESARHVRARLDKDPAIKLAGNVAELEQHLMEHFRLGDNSVEVGQSEYRSGKHIGLCYTYHSTDHNLF